MIVKMIDGVPSVFDEHGYKMPGLQRAEISDGIARVTFAVRADCEDLPAPHVVFDWSSPPRHFSGAEVEKRLDQLMAGEK